jgi:hypothetical protein
VSFIHSRQFDAKWERLKLIDDDLAALQIGIMAGPTVHPTIEGTGGLRKIRFSPVGQNRGKSGGYRVCYVHFEDHGIIFLATVYPKNEKDDLSPADKRAIRQLIAAVKDLLDEKGTIR